MKQLALADGKMIGAEKFGQEEEEVKVELTPEEDKMAHSIKVRVWAGGVRAVAGVHELIGAHEIVNVRTSRIYSAATLLRVPRLCSLNFDVCPVHIAGDLGRHLESGPGEHRRRDRFLQGGRRLHAGHQVRPRDALRVCVCVCVCVCVRVSTSCSPEKNMSEQCPSALSHAVAVLVSDWWRR